MECKDREKEADNIDRIDYKDRWIEREGREQTG